MTVAQNISMAHPRAVAGRFGVIRFAEEEKVAQRYIESLAIRTPSTNPLGCHVGRCLCRFGIFCRRCT